jgi:hypothetical protein
VNEHERSSCAPGWRSIPVASDDISCAAELDDLETMADEQRHAEAELEQTVARLTATARSEDRAWAGVQHANRKAAPPNRLSPAQLAEIRRAFDRVSKALKRGQSALGRRSRLRCASSIGRRSRTTRRRSAASSQAGPGGADGDGGGDPPPHLAGLVEHLSPEVLSC